MRNAARRIRWLCLILLVLAPLLDAQTFKLKSGQSVYVVAVRDSRLLTMCPGPHAITLPSWGRVDQSRTRVTYERNGTETILIPERYTDASMRDQLNDAIGDRREQSGITQQPETRYYDQSVVLPSPANHQQDKASSAVDQNGLGRGAWDPDLKSKIEKEFIKQKRYKIVDSSAKADIVFLAEGYYADTASLTRGSRRVALRDTDKKPTSLSAALAIALPAAEFQRHFADDAALVQAKFWQGSVITRNVPSRLNIPDNSSQTKPGIHPASPESLVKQFHNIEKEPANYPPVCAATTGTLQLPGGKPIR